MCMLDGSDNGSGCGSGNTKQGQLRAPGRLGSGRGWKKLRFQLKSFRKLKASSSGAARERPGMGKASILIKIL